MKLDPNFSEFIALLNANRVEYLLVGGYAVMMYGFPRFTGDMDIWIRSTEENANKVLRALAEFGFGSIGLETKDFTVENNVVQLGYPPLRIDVMTAIDGVDFEECFARRLVTDVAGVTVNVIHLDDLKANKRATGRLKDLNDIEHL
jgi:hypothetical protein